MEENVMEEATGLERVRQFLGLVVKLFALIRDTLTPMYVGLEFVEWLLGNGKEVFVEEFLKPLAARFLAAQRIIVIDENTIRVNLDAPLKLPYAHVPEITNKGYGWAKVHRSPKDGRLYVNDIAVSLRRSQRQQGDGLVKCGDLYEEMKCLPGIHPNIFEALSEHCHLVPEGFKHDENGNTVYLLSLEATFGCRGSDVCVFFMYFIDGKVYRGDRWFGDQVGNNYPTPVLEDPPAVPVE